MDYNIDVERLRNDLKDYFLAAYHIVSPLAIMDVTEVELADPETLIQIAINNGFLLDEYIDSYHL